MLVEQKIVLLGNHFVEQSFQKYFEKLFFLILYIAISETTRDRERVNWANNCSFRGSLC